MSPRTPLLLLNPTAQQPTMKAKSEERERNRGERTMAELHQTPALHQDENRKKLRRGVSCFLRDHRIRDLILNKHRLVEIPYTATLGQAVATLVANNVAAVPIAAPPGRWIGAGGSLILESDPVTGAVRKHYIGMLTMLDVLVHIAEEDGGGEEVADLECKMAVQVSAVIGNSLEGLSLWTLNPNTSILDCMETFSKGVHRALVPLESQTNNVVAVELMEASPGYRMLSQMDILNFLREHANKLKDIISCGVQDLGAVHETVFAVTNSAKAIEAIKSMRSLSLHAVPIVESPEASEDTQLLQDGRGKKLIGTISATDLRGYSISQLQSWLSLPVMDFKERVSSMAPAGSHTTDSESAQPELVTCYPDTSLAEVMERAVAAHVHRVWVVDSKGLLLGIVSLTDMLRIIRESVLRAEHELQNDVPNEPLVL